MTEASCTVNKDLVSSIGKGLLLFVGVGIRDTVEIAPSMASLVLNFKLWPKEGK